MKKIDSRKELQKLEKSKEKIELEIYQITEKIKEIDSQMHHLDPSDYKKMSELEKALQINKKKLFDNEELWLEIEAKIVKK
jgi:predicted  nucleic acid-binding Zn-ribbon protein